MSLCGIHMQGVGRMLPYFSVLPLALTYSVIYISVGAWIFYTLDYNSILLWSRAGVLQATNYYMRY